MLYDEISVEKIVDTESALEFMKEATKLATSAELDSIGQKLEAKSTIFHEHLSSEAIGNLAEEDFSLVLSHIFGMRRKAKRLLKKNPFAGLKESIDSLLHGTDPLEVRFSRYVETLAGFDMPLVCSMAGELLHFTYPDRYWLWSPWIWEQSKGGGALPLVIQSEASITGNSPGAQYESVGQAMKMVNAMGHLRGYSGTGRGMFGTDVFLACVYAVYMYTVFQMRLSQEFNRILPGLPEMTERVLGVHHMGTA